MDFWNRRLNLNEISEYYRTCDPYQGNLYSWTDLKFKTVGTIEIHQSEFCKPCIQNLTVDNAAVIYGDQTAFVKCSEGFQMQGNAFIHCLRTSKWELSKLPACKIVKCSPLKTPLNGRMILTKNSYKGQAKFTCDDGFELVGNEKISCLANGNWSDIVPNCKSIFECKLLKDPSNGVLVYASDSGVINEKLAAYPIGTFVEIKCDTGFYIEGENLISCTDNGEWDFDVEECIPEATPATSDLDTKIPAGFWEDFKEFLFHSCKSKGIDKPSLCRRFTSDFDTDLSSFVLPETSEYEGMDSKLLKHLSDIQASPDLASLNVENFLSKLLTRNVNSLIRDSHRFVICLYIDLILIDGELGTDSDETETTNINENIKRKLKKVALPVYKNYLNL